MIECKICGVKSPEFQQEAGLPEAWTSCFTSFDLFRLNGYYCPEHRHIIENFFKPELSVRQKEFNNVLYKPLK